jgi:hypothetical protein
MGFTNTAKLYRYAIPRLKCCIHRRARRERREKPYLYYAPLRILPLRALRSRAQRAVK